MFIERPNYTDKILDSIIRLPVTVLTGARQVGKTTLMKNIALNGQQLFLNGEDMEVSSVFEKYSLLKGFLKIRLNDDLSGFLLIDEFQYIPNISTMLKLLADDCPDLKIICTGSSSLDIKQTVEESLAGRIRIIEILPLSFDEYLRFCAPELHVLYSKYNIDTHSQIVDPQIMGKMLEFIIYGGLPRIALESDTAQKTLLINDIYKTYLMRDVRSYIRHEDSVGFNKLLRMLAAQIGNMVNINELSKSCGIQYRRCEEYLYLLEQMFIVKLVEPFLSNKRKTISKMKKVFFFDTGLRNMIYNSFNPLEARIDNGSLFENFVFLELQKNLPDTAITNFYRTVDGSEIDFIINQYRSLTSIEVKFKNLKNPVFHKGLAAFNRNEGVTRSFYINLNLNDNNQSINFTPGYFVGKIGWGK